MYFILGALTVALYVLSWILLDKKGKKRFFPEKILFIPAIAFLMLGSAWAFASMQEHEMQAAMMGLVMFGGAGIVCGIIAYRIIFAKPKSEATSDKE